MLQGWEGFPYFLRGASTFYHATYPGFQNGEDEQLLGQHFFGALSHVVVQRPGVSDILTIICRSGATGESATQRTPWAAIIVSHCR